VIEASIRLRPSNEEVAPS